ncbi:MAG: peptide chain release factor-like protein [Minisyncoccia bacterium]
MEINNNIITLSVYPGAGGDDAKDWSNMLLKMYKKYAIKKKWQVELINDNTLEIKGLNVYNILKNENGVHRLVRISPFDAKKIRHTSFALVEILPVFKDITKEIVIPPKDLKIEFYRSGGPGGQNVNKVETAVRIRHLPTQLVVVSQSERSQILNKEKALNMLKSKLIKLMEEQKVKTIDQLKIKLEPEWGNAMRSYVLYPYKQIKDDKLGIKISNVDEVLDGDLDILLSKKLK